MGFYTGVGSRDTPKDILKLMAEISKQMELQLRTGDADGADRAFRENAKLEPFVYSPWNNVPAWTSVFTDFFHPNPKALSGHARRLMNRNACQVLGENGKTRSKCLICWTPKGKYVGGTAQAMKIADYYNIPIYNLYFEEHIKALENEYNLNLGE